MAYGYSFQGYNEEKMARAVSLDLPVSKKHSYEVAKAIKNKTTAKAKKILEGIIAVKIPIKYRRFNRDLAHKSGIGSGSYPVKTAFHILKLVNSVEKNAEQKGIKNPVIIHIAANCAPTQYHHGRKRRRKMKRAHVEIVVAESEKIEKSESKQTKKEKKQGQEDKKESNEEKK